MMKRTNLKWLLFVIFVSVTFGGLAIRDKALGDEPRRYKPGEINVGDRVEADPMAMNKWLKCTVTKVNSLFPNEVDSFTVRCDGEPGTAASVYSAIGKTDSIRPAKGSAADKNTTGGDKNQRDEKPVDNQANTTAENATDAQAPEGCSCTLATNPKTSGAPSAALFKGLIKAQSDKDAKPGLDGAVCLTFKSFQMGAPQQWRPESDPRRVGTDRLGTKPKTIYPVKADYIVCTTYRSEWQTTEWTNTVYTCFKDEVFGDWKCRAEQGFDWKFKNKRVEKRQP
jgi:hypothetical protein